MNIDENTTNEDRTQMATLQRQRTTNTEPIDRGWAWVILFGELFNGQNSTLLYQLIQLTCTSLYRSIICMSITNWTSVCDVDIKLVEIT